MPPTKDQPVAVGSLTKAAIVEQVAYATGLTKKRAADHRQHGVRQHRGGAATRREGRTPRLRQFSSPAPRAAPRPQPQDRRPCGTCRLSTCRLLQARQGAEGADQPGAATETDTGGVERPRDCARPTDRPCVHHDSPARIPHMMIREHLEALDQECAELCRRYDHLSPDGIPNFRLLYSTAETFDTPGSVMFFGTNPGGDRTRAREAHRRLPFRQPNWSAYLDEDWNGHALQTAAREIAGLLADPGESGEDVLRRSPSGNLVPFRSENGVSELPTTLRDVRFGIRLIRLARPRALILFASNQSHWRQLMEALDRSPEPTYSDCLDASGFTFRESVAVAGVVPRYVFALPGLNQRNVGRNREVIGVLRNRVGRHRIGGRAFDDRPVLGRPVPPPLSG